MKKSIMLSVIASGLLMANDTVVLDKVVTISTATKTEKNIDGIAASVEVISEQDIKKMGAESLKDILSRTSGLNIQYGTFPSASSKSKSSISLRGMGSKGTLFLVDGRRLSGEVSNPYDLDRITASQIEKIEIVKGPMSTLYGADATGGVINIITKKPTSTPVIDFGIRYGQNENGDDKNKNINLSARGKVNKLGYSFYINKTKTTPYAQNENADVYARQAGGPNNGTNQKPSALTPATPSAPLQALSDNYIHGVTYREESDILTYGGRVDYDFTDSVNLGFEFNKFKEEREGSYIGYFHPSNVSPAPGTYLPVYNIPVDSRDDNDKLDTALDLTINATDDLVLKLRAYKSYYEKRNTTTTPYWQELQYSSQEDSALNGMNANVDIRTLEGLANYILNDNHLLTGGFETREEKREATVFTQANILTEKKVDYKALYLQDEWMIDETLNAIFGARYDDITDADSKATFKFGIVKNFSKAVNTRFNVAQGYRAPDIRELYIFKNTASGIQRGADTVDASLGKAQYDLKAESTLTYEIGLNGQMGETKYDVSVFHNTIKDYISQINKGAYYTFENLTKAKTYGIELSVNQNINDRLSALFSWAELKTKNEETNKKLEFNPDRVISARLLYDITNDLDTAITAKYIGEQYFEETVNRGTPTESLQDSTTNTYTTIDWNMNYDYTNKISFYGGVNNIADKKVDDVLGSSSGRYYFAGMKISF